MADTLILNERVECGAVLTSQHRDGVLRLARAFEAGGFDSVWAGDHISFYVPILESLTLLSFVAGATERVKIGSSVYLLPLRHPTTDRQGRSTLDVLSGGRLMFGVGVGGEFPPEFEASGVPVGERGSRTDEAIGCSAGSGRRTASPTMAATSASVRSRWTRSPCDPAARRSSSAVEPPALRRAGRLGDGYISHMCAAETYAQNLDVIRRHAEEAGRRDVPFETAAFLFTILDDDYERALDDAANLLQMIYNRPFRDAAKKYCLLGRPEDCLEQLQTFADAGFCRRALAPHGPG
jgi:alkanesulfonate monooxygenase SsuD/methylene tetrahydromethanopterin reductase-like flavin-dependent oxidoreductase (luciferase family)